MKNFKLSSILIVLIVSGAAQAGSSKGWTEAVSPDVQRQVTAWQTGQTGLAPVNDNGILRYPFGVTPVVTCGVEHICSIRLQAGEKILNVALGDSARWMANPVATGEGDTLTPMIVIKPINEGLTTNMLVTTTRHTYKLVLKSEKDAARYDSEIGYYWPTEIVQQWTANNDAVANAQERQDAETVADMPSLSANNLNFDYVIGKSKDPASTPVRVFDDGAHIYIQMPKAITATNAPALLVLGPDGTTQIVNYRLKNGFYIVDRLFDKAELIAGVGAESVKVTIEKKKPNTGWW